MSVFVHFLEKHTFLVEGLVKAIYNSVWSSAEGWGALRNSHTTHFPTVHVKTGHYSQLMYTLSPVVRRETKICTYLFEKRQEAYFSR